MIRRALAGIFVLWVFGFFWFSVTLPVPAGIEESDAIVVPTGGQGRIDHGLELLEQGRAPIMLVTGVDSDVKPREFAAEYEASDRLMGCCITLGFAAEDTKGNAAEIAEWAGERKVTSLRLVTTDWHMRRAALELSATLPAQITVVRDAVPSEPSFRILLLEYHKLIASALSQLLPR